MNFLIKYLPKKQKRKKPIRKKALTLLEIMIACGLLGILLSVLFGFYRNLLHFKKEYQLKKEIVNGRCNIRASLLPIFTRIPQPFPAEKIYSLYTDEFPESSFPALYFYFEKDIDPNPNFIGLLKGCLYLNENKELEFEISPKEGSPRKITLMSNLSSVRWEFIPHETYDWKLVWSKKETNLPLAIKMVLEEKKGTFIEYSFLLPQAQKEIIYKAKP